MDKLTSEDLPMLKVEGLGPKLTLNKIVNLFSETATFGKLDEALSLKIKLFDVINGAR